jgi:hypothetical protein
MSLALLAVDGVILLAMIGIALYGASALPSGAQVPIHFGPAAYGSWVPKGLGLVLWPAIGVVMYAVLIVHAHHQPTHAASGLTIGLTVALVVILVTEVGAIKVAMNRAGHES